MWFRTTRGDVPTSTYFPAGTAFTTSFPSAPRGAKAARGRRLPSRAGSDRSGAFTASSFFRLFLRLAVQPVHADPRLFGAQAEDEIASRGGPVGKKPEAS